MSDSQVVSHTAKNIVDRMERNRGNQKSDALPMQPPLLNGVYDISVEELTALLNRMFNSADDTLFEYADRAENNRQQTYYFDAMRELRLLRDDISRAFFQSFREVFRRSSVLGESAAALPDAFIATTLGANLSLVDEDTLEISLAITNMEQRILADNREDLSALLQRLNHLCRPVHFSKLYNPLAPSAICQCFATATNCLDRGVEIKLVVFKLFDKFVARNIGTLYTAANQMLIAAGVLPVIKYALPPREGAGVSAAMGDNPISFSAQTLPPITMDSMSMDPLARGSLPGQVGVQDVFADIRQSLHYFQAQRGQSGFPGTGVPPWATNHWTNGTGAGTRGLGAGPTAKDYYLTDDVLQGLSLVQQLPDPGFLQQDPAAVGRYIKQAVLNGIAQYTGEGAHARSIGQVESDTIDIVSLLFDVMVNDQELPDSIKAQITRLQIPYIKLSLIDRSFFTDKQHVARELLNELASSYEAVASERQAVIELAAEIARLVSRICKEFERDIAVFHQVLAEFRAYIKQQIELNRLVEELLLKANHRVATELQHRLSNKSVPEPVLQFILGPWKDVLKYVTLRETELGTDWQQYTAFVDDLIWSVQPKLTEFERHQLTAMIPALLTLIEQAAAVARIDPLTISQFNVELEKLHLTALRASYDDLYLDESGETGVLQVKIPELNVRVTVPHPSEQETDNAMSLYDEESASPVALRLDRSKPKKTAASDSFWEEIVLQTERHNDLQQDLQDVRLTQSPFYAEVNRLELGDWVEFVDGKHKKRGKLTWKCDFTGDFVFMNRLFKVVADIPLRDLLQRLSDGTAVIVEEQPLFDKAVHAVVSALRGKAA